MDTQVDKLLQRGSSVASSLMPATFNIFRLWRLTSAQQMTLLGLTSEEVLND